MLGVCWVDSDMCANQNCPRTTFVHWLIAASSDRLYPSVYFSSSVS